MRQSVISLLALAALSLISLGGCKKSLDSQVVGKWDGKMTLTAEQAKNPMAKIIEGLMNMSLEVKPDKSFMMTMGMIPVEGTWDTGGGKLNLHIQKFMGMDKAALTQKAQEAKNPNFKTSDMDKMDKPMVLSLASDGKTMTADDKGAMAPSGPTAPDGALIFTRVPDAAK